MTTMKTVTLLSVCAFIALLVGCNQAVSKPEVKPEPKEEQPPAAALRGRWATAEHWWREDDAGVDGIVGKRYKTLTFTKSRSIYEEAHVLASGELEDERQRQGTWEATADTITRIEQEWDDDAEALSDPERVPKKYYWTSDERVAMVIQSWDSDSADEPEYFQFTKVDPIDIDGTWRSSQFNDDGGFNQTWTITVNGSEFTYQYLTDQDPPHQFDLTGTANHDSEELVLAVTVDSTIMKDGDEVRGSGFWVGQTLRYAYAPSYDDNAIRLSQMWAEQEPVEGVWGPNPRNPHGDYGMYLQRVVP